MLVYLRQCPIHLCNPCLLHLCLETVSVSTPCVYLYWLNGRIRCPHTLHENVDGRHPEYITGMNYFDRFALVALTTCAILDRCNKSKCYVLVTVTVLKAVWHNMSQWVDWGSLVWSSICELWCFLLQRASHKSTTLVRVESTMLLCLSCLDPVLKTSLICVTADSHSKQCSWSLYSWWVHFILPFLVGNVDEVIISSSSWVTVSVSGIDSHHCHPFRIIIGVLCEFCCTHS